MIHLYVRTSCNSRHIYIYIYMYICIYMTQLLPCVCNDSSIRRTSSRHTYTNEWFITHDMTHSFIYEWVVSWVICICVTWLYAMTHLYVAPPHVTHIWMHDMYKWMSRIMSHLYMKTRLIHTRALTATAGCPWHYSVTYVMWRIHMRHVTHSHVRHVPFSCVTCRIHVCVIWLIDSYVWHDSIIRADFERLPLAHDMTHSRVRHDSFSYVTRLMHVCDMTHSRMRNYSFIYAWHDWIINLCVTWPIYTCFLPFEHTYINRCVIRHPNKWVMSHTTE